MLNTCAYFAKRVFCPAYAVEEYAFGSNHASVSPLVKRVSAVAAPLLYAYQTALYGGVLAAPFIAFYKGAYVASLAFATVSWMPCLGVIPLGLADHTIQSLKGLVASTLEIPQKLWSTSGTPPNYFNDRHRGKNLAHLHYWLPEKLNPWKYKDANPPPLENTAVVSQNATTQWNV